jgi:hypothetical protein
MKYVEKKYSSLKYLVSIPPGKRRKRRWPVLVFLHGNDQAAPEPLRCAMTEHGPLRVSSGTSATQRFVVVAPQLPARGRWTKTQADAVRGIAQEAVDKHYGNPAQIYLTGFSYGGDGVLEIGVSEPNDWAALWPVDPTIRPRKRINRPIWVSAGERARGNKGKFRKVWRVQDRVPNVDPPSKRVYEDRNLCHVCTATAAYADEGIYRWLLTHSSRTRTTRASPINRLSTAGASRRSRQGNVRRKISDVVPAKRPKGAQGRAP